MPGRASALALLPLGNLPRVHLSLSHAKVDLGLLRLLLLQGEGVRMRRASLGGRGTAGKRAGSGGEGFVGESFGSASVVPVSGTAEDRS